MGDRGVTDSEHVRSLGDAESRRFGLLGSNAGAAAWWRILLALGLLIGLPLLLYLALRPSAYEGAVRWGSGYSTVQLVGIGKSVAVTDDTDIWINGEHFAPGQLQSPLFPKQGDTVGAVEYRAYRRPQGAPAVWGRAVSITVR